MIRFILLGVLMAGWFSAPAAELFGPDSQWRYLRGLAEASSPNRASWRTVAFNDAAWSLGPTPVFYGESLTGTLLSDMQGGYTSVFLRKTFVIQDPNAISELQLETLSDDGFIAWINGQEVKRYNVPEGDLAYNSVSLAALSEPIPLETTLIDNPRELLVPGINVIAVHGFNASISGSSDFVFNASLAFTADTNVPFVQGVVPPENALVRELGTIEVIFSEPVKNVDAADLLINGTAATNVTAFNESQYVFEFPEPAPGPVQLSWVADHGIVDFAATPNRFGGATWSYNLDPDAQLPGLMISEFMADNDDTLNDENGDASDWVEVFNPTGQSADLGGWFLSNDSNNLVRWRFPSVSLDPNSYLVVFASEKNRTNPAARLHTNFKLAKEGSFLALVDPRTNIASRFSPSYPAQLEDISYGRERSDPARAGFFTRPTPGAANVAGGPGFAPPVQFSQDGGTFRSTFELVLSTASSNGVIRYAVGTNMPTEASLIYTQPIVITNTMQVRARVFEPGLLPGEPRSENYVMLAGTTPNFTSDLPIVILHNYGRGAVPATGERPVILQVFEPKNGVASMTNTPDLSQRARFRLRGSSTEGIVKSSYAVETWDEFQDDEKVDLLGMPSESDWVFYAPNNFEPVLIHNPFMYGLSREIGRYAPRTRFVEVYLNTAGGALQDANYRGIYVIEEKIKRGTDRVDVDKLEAEHLNAPEVSGGYMLKIDRPDPGDSQFTAGRQVLNYVDPKGPIIRTVPRDPQEQYIRRHLDEFGTVLFGANFRDPVNGYAKYIDAPSWIDHHILNVLAFNVDALRLSTYLYKPRNGKIEFGPIWDFDRALGSTDGRDANPIIWSNGTEYFRPTGEYPWWGRLFQDLDFWQKWIDRWEELRRDKFALTNLNRLINGHVDEVRKAQPREQAKWRFNPRGGSYQAEVNLMTNYLKRRAEFIDAQLVRPPALTLPAGSVPNGTQLTITTSGPAVYYTLDGSDPRSIGGVLSANALLYTGPVTLRTNARVFARSRNPQHTRGPLATNSQWSGFVAATYVVEMPELAVTEIMYNPAAPITGSQTNQDFEFIELRNTGTKALNLAGVSLSGGVRFEFTGGVLAAGEYIVVVKNTTVFQSRYGSAARVAGEYIGNLDNAGDRIVLLGALQEPIADFSFVDGWHPVTDGLGFSLVPVVESPGSASADWRASGIVQGTPGRADPGLLPVATVFVNEVLTHTEPPLEDTVELFNPTAGPVSIAGWFLSDEFDTPKKYRFPAGTTIPAHGYLLVGDSREFDFSSKGEEIYLFGADASGELTGYAHGFSFGAAANGVSFGRHLTTDGREVFPAQSSRSLGTANAGPLLPPVVVSELMFQPPLSGTNDNTIDEFIELRNVSTQPVNLFDAAHPENTWRLRGGTDFDFPPGVTLPAGGSLLLVNFDPGNTVFNPGFRTRMQVPPATPLYGPYSGKLSNNGETVRLLRPDAPDAAGTPDAGFVPYIVVEEIHYSATSPWPADAAGTGNSLQRMANSFADDPASWRGAVPTPGASTTGTPVTDADGDGLPDDWETANGFSTTDGTGIHGAAGDVDGDGMTNLQEFTAGTDPRNIASRFGFDEVTVEAGGVTFRFIGAPNKAYSLVYRTNLELGAWTKLVDLPSLPSGGTREARDNNPGGGSRFYRLVIAGP